MYKLNSLKWKLRGHGPYGIFTRRNGVITIEGETSKLRNILKSAVIKLVLVKLISKFDVSMHIDSTTLPHAYYKLC